MSVPLAPPGVWQIDAGHTQIGFSVRHLGISSVHGLFTDYSGHALIGDDLTSTCVELTAATKSVHTGNAWRDEHLVGELFFDAERFPAMDFRSVAVAAAEGAGNAYRLSGELTIKGTTRRVDFDLEFSGTAVFPMDEKLHAGFLATTTIKRSEFGIGYGVPLASDEIAVRIDAQLIAPDR